MINFTTGSQLPTASGLGFGEPTLAGLETSLTETLSFHIQDPMDKFVTGLSPSWPGFDTKYERGIFKGVSLSPAHHRVPIGLHTSIVHQIVLQESLLTDQIIMI